MNTSWNRLLDQFDHRPWALPNRPWSVKMCWHDLLFMHWPVPSRVIAALLPPGLEVDTFDGTSWIAVVPFRMTDIGARRTPPVPWISSFEELNVRTYVKNGGQSGVWFFSLDAANRLAVETARAWFHLPYFHASMHLEQHDDGWISYMSRRRDRRGRPAFFRGRYRPIEDRRRAKLGTLEHWLTERYCFFSADRRGRLSRTDVHHHPWPLQTAEAIVEVNSMTDATNVTLPGSAPVLHFARKLEVIAWTPISV